MSTNSTAMPRLLLALETSGTTGGAALLAEGRLVGSVAFTSATLYSQRLLPSVEWLLERTGLPVEQIDSVAVSKGPGSFTGLRIGMSAAKGIAYANGARLVGVSTLESMALRAAFGTGELVCPLMDARQGEVYAALYRAVPTPNESTSPAGELQLPHLLSVQPEFAGLFDQFATWQTDEPITFCGEGAIRFADRLRETFGNHFRLAPGIRSLPSAEEVAYLGLKRLLAGEQDDLMLLEPEYLRPTYVQRKASGTA